MPDEPTDPKGKVLPFPKKAAYEGPVLPDICWRRGFREFRDAHKKATEACDEFLFNAYLVGLGCVIGRNLSIDAGTPIWANIFSVNVGASGRSRKTTAQNFMLQTLRRLGSGVAIVQGISSPEGVIRLLVDNPKTLITLNEIKSLFTKGAMESTRGLIPKLAELYDCPPDSSTPTKIKPLTADRPFLCMTASTTREWFQNSIDKDDIRGGLGNRFLYFIGPDKDPICWPENPDAALIETATKILADVQTDHVLPKVYTVPPRVKAVMEPWYENLRNVESGDELSDAMAQRLDNHAKKMALLYAAVDQTTTVTVDHIEAGMALIDYQQEVHKYVLEGINDSKAVRDENRIEKFLRRKKVFQTTREVQQGVRGFTADELRKALRSMAAIGRIVGQTLDGPWGPKS